jgi:hypothetical protein
MTPERVIFLIERGAIFNRSVRKSLNNSSCPGGIHACVPKRPHFGVQARMMKMIAKNEL